MKAIGRQLRGPAWTNQKAHISARLNQSAPKVATHTTRTENQNLHAAHCACLKMNLLKSSRVDFT
jgi:hypothetical protein